MLDWQPMIHCEKDGWINAELGNGLIAAVFCVDGDVPWVGKVFDRARGGKIVFRTQKTRVKKNAIKWVEDWAQTTQTARTAQTAKAAKAAKHG